MLSAPTRLALAALLTVDALGFTATGSASLGDQRSLAERYAPVVRLVEQKHECGPGEPYRPMDVNAFGQPSVASCRAPKNRKTGVRHWLSSTAECNKTVTEMCRKWRS